MAVVNVDFRARSEHVRLACLMSQASVKVSPATQEKKPLSLPPAMDAPVGKNFPDDETFNDDSEAATGLITVEWRPVGAIAFRPLAMERPLVYRGAVPVDVEFRVTMLASASHLRSAILASVDCGGGNFVLVSGNTEHWHLSACTNTEVLQAIYRLPKRALPGTYGFGGEVTGFAVNSIVDDGHRGAAGKAYNPRHRHAYPSVSFSVVDGDEQTAVHELSGRTNRTGYVTTGDVTCNSTIANSDGSADVLRSTDMQLRRMELQK